MKKRFGDRKDAKKVRDIDGMHKIMCRLMPDRCDSDVYINQKINVSKLLKYIKDKNENNKNEKYTVFHAFSQAIAKVIYNRPLMNRFIANKAFYDRNDIILSFVAKVSFEDHSKELLSVINVKDNYTIDDMYKVIKEKVTNIRSNTSSDTNDVVSSIGNLPRFILSPIIGIVKFLDRHGWLPNSFVNDNIYYSSVILSNLGSIKCGAIYHHLCNFGTSSILVTMGEIHKEKIINKDGKEEILDICEFGVNLDERIADGFYFAKSISLLKYILENPELLDEPVNTKIEINGEK